MIILSPLNNIINYPHFFGKSLINKFYLNIYDFITQY